MLFFNRHYQDIAEILLAVETWQIQNLLQPLLNRLDPMVISFREQARALFKSFLGGTPAPLAERSTAEGLFLLSQKKDVNSAARRYCFGSQAKGLKIHLDDAPTPEAHIKLACRAKHPALNLANNIEPLWKYVFDQWERSFATRGREETCRAIRAHRRRMRDWIDELADQLTLLSSDFSASMPPSSAIIARHINIPLFYTLLSVTDFPNPQLAFRLFTGAKLVGEFDSPALVQRDAKGLPLNNETLRAISNRAASREFTVKPTLSAPAAQKCMEKMQKEYKSESLVGPFRTKKDLYSGMQREIRKHPGLGAFVVLAWMVVISPQFSVEELHAYQEESDLGDPAFAFSAITEPKVRNICNEKIMNDIATSFATYIPNTHGDVACIMLYWLQMFSAFFSNYKFLGWPSDFTGAYRQMPLSILHILMGGTVYYHYDPHDPGLRYAFYRSLPFGSSLAPANWSEIVVALAHIMAVCFLAIITHCVDDVCNIELQETVRSARTSFLHLCAAIGFVLDMEKSIEPCENFIYLGLKLILPQSLPHVRLSFSIPEMRRRKILSHLLAIIKEQSLTSGDASSMRGRLFFYAFWFQEARTFLADFAARQYSTSGDTSLTPDLLAAITYFVQLMHDTSFIRGVEPERILNRQTAIIYTDGALEGDGILKPFLKGIGGVLFSKHLDLPLYYGETIPNHLPNFGFIAIIEMFAIYRALQMFRDHIRGKAILLFVDNTHAIGCLLRRSASVREPERKRRINFSGQKWQPWKLDNRPSPSDFENMPLHIRTAMNIQCRRIWRLVSELDLVLWIEYVNTKVNIADPPSRGDPMPIEARRIFT